MAGQNGGGSRHGGDEGPGTGVDVVGVGVGVGDVVVGVGRVAVVGGCTLVRGTQV